MSEAKIATWKSFSGSFEKKSRNLRLGGQNDHNLKYLGYTMLEYVKRKANGKEQLVGAFERFRDRFADEAQLIGRTLGQNEKDYLLGHVPHGLPVHVQHHRVDRLSHLRDEVRTMTGQSVPEQEKPQQAFSSGRELIEAVRARREEAQMLKDLDGELSNADALDGDRIDGVKVLWISPGRAARDETAFRHALATAHRLREAGERMTDAKIIDAYERAYNIAQPVGADLRQPEMPSQRDRQTMARRVRGYVLSGNRGGGASSFSGSTGGVGMRERKALATMGRKGGQKAAERWKDRDSEYAQAEIRKLKQANVKRATGGRVTARQIANYFDDTMLQTGAYPSIPDAMKEFSVSRPTVKRALKKAEISLPRGRRACSK